jgi:iron complex transport system substrate-binding protein
VIKLAGGRNIMEGSRVPYPQISLEVLLEKQPDVIIFAHMTKMQNPIDEVKRRANWDKLKAVREGKFYAIDGDIIDRPGPRLIQAVEVLHKILYPKRRGIWKTTLLGQISQAGKFIPSSQKINFPEFCKKST